MTDEQAVVEATDEQAKPVAEGNDAQDDVESLLSQYDDATKPEQKEKPELEAQVDELRQQFINREVDDAISAVVEDITGDLPVDNEITMAWLDKQARDDPRLLNAFLDRKKNPANWNRIEAKLKTEFGQRFKQAPDKEATETKASVDAAVRRASTKAPEEDQPDFAKMPDPEFERWKRENLKPR